MPVVVAALVAINLIVFAQELAAVDTATLINAFAVIPYDLKNGIDLAAPSPHPGVLTLLTAMFVHGSWVHVGANMLFLAAFGPEVEAALGHVRFALVYLGCGLLGNVVQAAVDLGSHVPSVGASGAVAGILGAYLILHPLRFGKALFIGLWAALQFLHGIGALSSHVTSEQSGGTAYFAHIGGFIAGLVLAEIARHRFVSREGP